MAHFLWAVSLLATGTCVFAVGDQIQEVSLSKHVILRGPVLLGGHGEVVQGLVYAPGTSSVVLSTTSQLISVDVSEDGEGNPKIGKTRRKIAQAVGKIYNHLGSCDTSDDIMICPVEIKGSIAEGGFMVYNLTTLEQISTIAWTNTHVPWIAIRKTASKTLAFTSGYRGVTKLELMEIKGSEITHTGDIQLSNTLEGVQGGAFGMTNRLYVTCNDERKTMWAINTDTGTCNVVVHFDVQDEIEGLTFVHRDTDGRDVLWVMFATTNTYIRDLLTILAVVGLCSFAIAYCYRSKKNPTAKTHYYVIGAAVVALVVCEFMLVRAYIVRVSVK